MSKSLIFLYDRTLRKNAFQESSDFSTASKLHFIEKLDHFKIDYIEAGQPGRDRSDVDFFKKITDIPLQHTKIAAYGNICRSGFKPSSDPEAKLLLATNAEVISLTGNLQSLAPQEDNLLKAIKETITFFKAHNKEVIYNADHFFDLYKSNPALAQKIVETAFKHKADKVILCDTLGGTIPKDLQSILDPFFSKFSENIIGVEFFNDCGLASALSLEAADQGAKAIYGTFNGYGNRVGCANFSTLIPNLHFKMGLPLSCEDEIHHLTQLTVFVDEITNTHPNPKRPFVGQHAFYQHNEPDNEQKLRYHIQPNLIGNQAHLAITHQLDEVAVVSKAKEFNLTLTPDTMALKYFVNELKELNTQGFQYEAADASFKLLLNQKLFHKNAHFQVMGYRVVVGKSALTQEFTAEATVKIKINGFVQHTVAEGNGPISALDHALRKALIHDFPEINDMHLIDFKVRILENSRASDSQIRVQVESTDGSESWTTMGVSENIIEASWQALRDAFEYKLMLDKEVIPAQN